MPNMTPLTNLGLGGLSVDDDLDDNLSKERRFGHDVRRLVKLVGRAFHNRSKLKNADDFKSFTTFITQCTSPGISKNITKNTSNPDVIGKECDSLTPISGPFQSLFRW